MTVREIVAEWLKNNGMECDTFCLSIKEVTMCDYKEEAGDYVFED